MTIELLQKLLQKVKEMRDAEITIPENLLQAIDSLAGQLEPFLKDSPQKGEFDAIERHNVIIDIFFSLWKIFYYHLYQQICQEHKKLIEIVGIFRFNEKVDIRKKDIEVRLKKIHDMLVGNWHSPIPPLIEQLILPEGLFTHEMFNRYTSDGITHGKEPDYGYKGDPSLAQDAIPLSFQEYVNYQIYKKHDGIDWGIEDWSRTCTEFTGYHESDNFLCDPESNIKLGEQAMEMYCSMPYKQIITIFDEHPYLCMREFLDS